MKRFSSPLSAALAFSLVLGAGVPAMAAPAFAPMPLAVASSGVIEVQNRQDRRRADRRELRQDRREARQDRREDRREARQFRRQGNYAYYGDYRGYRDRRSGYRQYNGYWFPPAAFIVGALIGGAVAQPVIRSGGSSHVEWCYDRWRSYRAYDNTYQPLNGPRRYCDSPFG